jgi:4-amino-4-deoxychorismate lyase
VKEHPSWSSGRRYPLPGCSGSERSFEEVAISLTLNGRAATAEDLRSLALVNYGHYTSMQVRDRRVRGLDLHLTRLTAASTELFGCPLPPERVLPWIDAALDGNLDASVQVTVYARHPDAVDTGAPVEPDVLVAVSAGVQTTTAPVAGVVCRA